MAAQHMALDSFWVDKSKYDDAERAYYEGQGNEILTPLADEVARARQRLNEIRGNFADGIACNNAPDQRPKNVEPEVNAVKAEAPSVVQPAKTVEPENKNNAETSKPIPAQEKETSNLENKNNAETSKPIPAQEKETSNLENKNNAETSKPIPAQEKQTSNLSSCSIASFDVGAIKFLEKKVTDFEKVIEQLQKQFNLFNTRLSSIESSLKTSCPAKPAAACQKPAVAPAKLVDDDDDDVDLFGSESEDDEAASKVKEERLAAYNAKKSKKPALIAKSSIILDVKPWDDETDMKALEAEVRKIEMDGLLWGASKLVPLAYGIHKLQINCVVEDEKVSIDLLQEQIEAVEDFVQSVDIAAFNKI